MLMDYVMPHLTFLLRWKGAVTSTAPESGGALADLVTGPEYSHTSGKMVRIRDEMQPGENALVETTQDDLWDWTVKFLDLTPEQIKL